MNAAELVLRGTLGGVLMHALDPSRYPIEGVELAQGRAMRWPSAIAGIEDRIDLEGFYGFAAITGRQKLGKSLIAFASAATAAEQGMRVLYVDAELDALQLSQRLVNFGGPDWYPRHRENLVLRLVTGPCSLTQLVEDLALRVGAETERVLIVLDSISRIAQRVEAWSRIPREGSRFVRALDYWSALRLVIDWCATIRRLAPTQIGVLVTSEENKVGASKGVQLEYAADMALRVKGQAGSELVELSIPFSREGGDGDLGPYRRVWREARFVRCERAEASSSASQEVML